MTTSCPCGRTGEHGEFCRCGRVLYDARYVDEDDDPEEWEDEAVTLDDLLALSRLDSARDRGFRTVEEERESDERDADTWDEDEAA